MYNAAMEISYSWKLYREKANSYTHTHIHVHTNALTHHMVNGTIM